MWKLWLNQLSRLHQQISVTDLKALRVHRQQSLLPGMCHNNNQLVGQAGRHQNDHCNELDLQLHNPNRDRQHRGIDKSTNRVQVHHRKLTLLAIKRPMELVRAYACPQDVSHDFDSSSWFLRSSCGWTPNRNYLQQINNDDVYIPFNSHFALEIRHMLRTCLLYCRVILETGTD